MSFLDAKALTDDPDGLSFLAGVIRSEGEPVPTPVPFVEQLRLSQAVSLRPPGELAVKEAAEAA